jgi:hypothetical protein
MFTSTNLAIRMIMSASLRRRLPKKVVEPKA